MVSTPPTPTEKPPSSVFSGGAVAGVSVAAGDLLAVAYLAWWDGSRDFARVEYAVELLFREIGYVL